MARDLIIRSRAEAELADAFNWYENQVSELGSDFLKTVDAALAGVLRNPAAHPIVHGKIRRCLVRRFPYAIFYLIEPTKIIVLAVFHVRRNPTDWKKR